MSGTCYDYFISFVFRSTGAKRILVGVGTTRPRLQWGLVCGLREENVGGGGDGVLQ